MFHKVIAYIFFSLFAIFVCSFIFCTIAVSAKYIALIVHDTRISHVQIVHTFCKKRVNKPDTYSNNVLKILTALVP